MTQRRILVIDDEPGIRESVRDYFESKGFAVLVAANGGDGIQLAVDERPDLILLDVELPDMSGYTVSRTIRSTPEIQHTPIIMLTAHSLEKEELKGFEAGVDDYMSKPFKPSRLLARVETAIGRLERTLDANPLTRLPGNMSIMSELQRRITDNHPFAVLYFDLNNFKSFNDRYGFMRGDQAIKLTADVLTKTFAAARLAGSFLGHVGGDDFIGIVDSHDVMQLCEVVIDMFERSIRTLYDPEDLARGRIFSTDRKGNKVELPIMGLAIAVITNRQRKFEHPAEVSLISGDLKKWVKSVGRSAYAIDRRS
jgi:diguanylate cyclase (GGDEF)-like protein